MNPDLVDYIQSPLTDVVETERVSWNHGLEAFLKTSQNSPEKHPWDLGSKTTSMLVIAAISQSIIS